MCFSATASISASAFLTVTGVVLFVRGVPSRYLFLALIPWLFAFQQGLEGIQWLEEGESRLALFVYAWMATCFWPLWIPFTFWWMEENPARKQFLTFLGGMGFLNMVYCITILPGVEVDLCSATVRYLYPLLGTLSTSYAVGICYVGIVLFPFFISKERSLNILGGLMFIAAVIAFWIDQFWFLSLWCFIAAVFSLGLILIIPKARHH